ncbi:MAG: hypothetical protein ACMUIP_06915 [bacterium]
MKKWRCPTCGALYRGGTHCHRCHCNLSLLITVREQADEWKKAALLFLMEGWLNEALEAIQRSLFLDCNREAEELEALIFASQGKFELVLPFIIDVRK